MGDGAAQKRRGIRKHLHQPEAGSSELRLTGMPLTGGVGGLGFY